jgi:hypothetical protein
MYHNYPYFFEAKMMRVNVPMVRYFLLLSVVYISACGVWKSGEKAETITGTIEMVGNHPFEYLVVRQEDGTAVKVHASATVLQQLRFHQGEKIIITCSPIYDTEGERTADVYEYKFLHQ